MLAADTPTGLETLRVVFESMELCYAQSIEEAIELLRTDIDIIVCGIHFAESRMFDLLRLAKANSATRAIPFVCYRDLDSELGSAVLESLEIAAKALGAATFVDMHTLKRQYGVTNADDRFRQIVHKCLAA